VESSTGGRHGGLTAPDVTRLNQHSGMQLGRGTASYMLSALVSAACSIKCRGTWLCMSAARNPVARALSIALPVSMHLQIRTAALQQQELVS
jgi:hypothetical protein